MKAGYIRFPMIRRPLYHMENIITIVIHQSMSLGLRGVSFTIGQQESAEKRSTR